MTTELRRPAPKMDEVVCAHNFLGEKGTKPMPILQATVTAARSECRASGKILISAAEPVIEIRDRVVVGHSPAN